VKIKSSVVFVEPDYDHEEEFIHDVREFGKNPGIPIRSLAFPWQT
jgi:hypothetical protein